MAEVTINRRGARFGPGGASSPHRYRLWRTFSAGTGTLAFVMLNPSTADAYVEDPTIRRCIGFAQRWGFARLEVANLFAGRATKPPDLFAMDDPVGPRNNRALADLARRADRLVVAWGTGWAQRSERDQEVLRLLSGRRLYCLGVTAKGHPRHPLYARADLRPTRFC